MTITVAIVTHQDTENVKVQAWQGILSRDEVLDRLTKLFSTEHDPWSTDDIVMFYDVDVHPAVEVQA